MTIENRSRMRVPRSRGATSGLLLILLGVWGGLIPFIGPYFRFAFTPDVEWTWTAARGWLEVLPAGATVLGGLLLLGAGHRATGMLGGWLAVLAGAWFIVGRWFAGPLGIGDAGSPVATTDMHRALLEIGYFYGLGAVIIFLGASALGRMSVLGVRDVGYGRGREPVAAAHRPAEPVAAETPTTAGAATTAEPAAAGEPATERVESPAAGERVAAEEPRRRRFGGLFRRREKTTTTTR